jgi:hypothetical protein
METFLKQTRLILKPILDHSGAVLYSSFQTLRPGRIYILGLNPGGDNGHSIRKCLDSLPYYDENSYMDEDWSTEKRHYDVGGHPLQQHLKWLIENLGYDLKNVCASNLIFTRSSGQWGADYPIHADLCWKVHELIIELVKPDVLIVFGNGSISPYDYLLRKHYGHTGSWPRIQTIESGHSNWKCKSFSMRLDDNRFTVVGLPHLSRYSVENKPWVLDWVKQKIQ